MDKVRVNLEICGEIAKGRIVNGQIVSDDLVLFVNGYNRCCGYFLSKEDIAFNFDRIKLIPKEEKELVDLSAIDPQNEIKPTRELKLLDNEKDMARKFVGADGKEIWLNKKYLRNITPTKCKFYVDYRKYHHGMVFVVENGTVVMCVMPVCIY